MNRTNGHCSNHTAAHNGHTAISTAKIRTDLIWFAIVAGNHL
ncbi:MAG: hypothetical protein ABSH33_23665 [Steroidobacteraceae bacterium]